MLMEMGTEQKLVFLLVRELEPKWKGRGSVLELEPQLVLELGQMLVFVLVEELELLMEMELGQ